MTGSRCWPAGTGWHRPGSGRWRPPWSGATSCWMSASGGCSAAVSVFPGPFTLEARRGGGRGRRRAGGAAPGGLLAAGPAAGRGGWPVPGTSMLETLRAYGAAAAGRGRRAGRGGRRAGRVRAAGGRGGRGGAADQHRRGWPRPGGWTPRTPPCARCWPGRWTMTRPAAVRLVGALGWWWLLRGRLAGQYPLLREAGRARRAGQRRVVRRAVLARPGGAVLGRPGRGAGPFHRGLRRRRGPGAVPGAGRLPGRPVGDVAEHGPVRRGGRGGPPRPGHGPGARLPGRRGATPWGRLGIAAWYGGDLGGAVQLARQAAADPGHPRLGPPGGAATSGLRF